MPKTNGGLDAFNLGGFSPERIADAQRRNLEALQQANQIALEAAQAVLRRQLEIGREVMAEWTAVFSAFGQPGQTMQDWMAGHAERSTKAIEASVANARELAELMTKANSGALEVLTKRVNESLDEMRDTAGTRRIG
jgi:phasin family protein